MVYLLLGDDLAVHALNGRLGALLKFVMHETIAKALALGVGGHLKVHSVSKVFSTLSTKCK
jgi:hypothetical protein